MLNNQDARSCNFEWRNSLAQAQRILATPAAKPEYHSSEILHGRRKTSAASRFSTKWPTSRVHQSASGVFKDPGWGPFGSVRFQTNSDFNLGRRGMAR